MPVPLGWRDVRRVHPGRRLRRRTDEPVVALDGLTLDAEAGALLVLVGPSGSGKTTALRTLAGIEPIDDGSVHLGGRDLAGVPPHRRDIAMVFQDLALFPHLRVEENILFGEAIREVPAADRARRLAQVAEVLDLAALLRRKPAELSGGQQQRVALARAMVREPAAFLLDEPLSNTDPQLRVGARAEIVALQRRLGVTMVHVTHDQSEAMTMGDRIAVLRDGRLQQVGTPREVYDRPASLFVATFMGSPAMNVLPPDTPLAAGPTDGHVGVRPEDLTLSPADAAASTAPAGHDPAPTVAGAVLLREDLGSEVVLVVDTAVGQIAVRRGARDDTPSGAAVLVGLADTATVHRFDATGARVVERSPVAPPVRGPA